eukprot:scaffold44972_cov27-Tisochrysis_lutea.AAC.1
MKEGLGPAEGCAAAVCAAYTQGVDPGAGHACVGSRLILVPGSGGHAGSGHGHGGLVGGPTMCEVCVCIQVPQWQGSGSQRVLVGEPARRGWAGSHSQACTCTCASMRVSACGCGCERVCGGLVRGPAGDQMGCVQVPKWVGSGSQVYTYGRPWEARRGWGWLTRVCMHVCILGGGQGLQGAWHTFC